MTLLLAVLVIAGLHLPWWLYPLSVVVWVLHLAFHDDD